MNQSVVFRGSNWSHLGWSWDLIYQDQMAGGPVLISIGSAYISINGAFARLTSWSSPNMNLLRSVFFCFLLGMFLHLLYCDFSWFLKTRDPPNHSLYVQFTAKKPTIILGKSPYGHLDRRNITWMSLINTLGTKWERPSLVTHQPQLQGYHLLPMVFRWSFVPWRIGCYNMVALGISTRPGFTVPRTYSHLEVGNGGSTINSKWSETRVFWFVWSRKRTNTLAVLAMISGSSSKPGVDARTWFMFLHGVKLRIQDV